MSSQMLRKKMENGKVADLTVFVNIVTHHNSNLNCVTVLKSHGFLHISAGKENRCLPRRAACTVHRGNESFITRMNGTGFVGGLIPREDGAHGTTQQVLPRTA